jgi:uncharacterized protein YqjF (DUF2071 family)
MTPRPFLTAEWRHLAMLNYAIDPALIAHLVPRYTVADQHDGKTFVSLVGFRFLRTRVHGFWIPFHSNFDEVNLRFYVRRGDRRGVVFVREIVPRYAIALIARLRFHERYISLPMAHDIGPAHAEYRWRVRGRWNTLRVECSGDPGYASEGSHEQFITEHYWGYAATPGGATLEYQVEHEKWRIWKATAASFEGDVSEICGPALAACLRRPPDSAFLAEGSSVIVYQRRPC